MLVRRFNECKEIIAGDGTKLRELLHPNRQSTAARYSIAHAIVPVSSQSIPHRLKNSEVYYILSGEGEMHINNEIQYVSSGDTIDIPPQATQWIQNTGKSELIFLCIVDPAWRVEDEEIVQ